MPKHPAQLMEELANRAMARQAETGQLPLWPEDCRGVPNEIARSSLFNARNRKQPRAFVKDEPLFVLGDGEITYSGEELRQDDLDVWLGVLHEARTQPLGEPISFVPYQFLKKLDWSRSKLYYERLRTCLDRMKVTGVKVYSTRLKAGVNLSLIRKFEWRNDTTGESLNHWRVWLEPEIQKLFGPSLYTRLDWQQRRKLTPLARWLHSMYASHRQPYAVRIESLARGAGLSTARLRSFRTSLIRALDDLVAIGFLENYQLENNLLTVQRTVRDIQESEIVGYRLESPALRKSTSPSSRKRKSTI